MAAADAELKSWDRIEGIPDPHETRQLVGHREVLDGLAGHHANGRMHHAWLLSGPRGIGKATLACRFAGHLFRHPQPSTAPHHYEVPPADDRTEGRVASGGHPNLLHLRRPWDHDRKRWKTVLTVEEVRRTVSFFGTSAGEAGWRVCIVDTADDLNASAANALLKMLEEPPPRTVFFVLAHSPKGLLPTIRSRCQKVNVRALSPGQVSEALALLGVDTEIEEPDRDLVAGLSGGSVRRAILLVRGNGIDLYQRFAALAAEPARPDWAAIHALANDVAPAAQEDRYRLLLDLAQDYVGRRLRGEAEPVAGGRGAGLPDASGQGISILARWVEVWEKTRRSADLADAYNLDRKQVVLNLFEAMREAA